MKTDPAEYLLRMGFDVISKLGSNPYSVCYLIKDRDRDFIVKTMNPDSTRNRDGKPISYKRKVEHLLREKRIVSLASGIDGLLDLFSMQIQKYRASTAFRNLASKEGFCRDHDIALVYYYVPGRFMRPDEHLEAAALEPLADTVEQLHSRRIARLGLRPENLIIGSDRRSYIADLGRARLYGSKDNDAFILEMQRDRNKVYKIIGGLDGVETTFDHDGDI